MANVWSSSEHKQGIHCDQPCVWWHFPVVRPAVIGSSQVWCVGGTGLLSRKHSLLFTHNESATLSVSPMTFASLNRQLLCQPINGRTGWTQRLGLGNKKKLAMKSRSSFSICKDIITLIQCEQGYMICKTYIDGTSRKLGPFIRDLYFFYWWSLNIMVRSVIMSSYLTASDSYSALQWRHNAYNGVWNHQPHDCLLNRLFRRRSKKTSKLCVTGLCTENSPVTGEFPAQMASNADFFSIWWRHHEASYACTLWARAWSYHILKRNSRLVDCFTVTGLRRLGSFQRFHSQSYSQRRAGLFWSQQDFEWLWSVPLSSASLY